MTGFMPMPLLTACFVYPADFLAAVIPKPIQGLIWIAFFSIIIFVLAAIMLRCGKAKTKSNR